MIIECQTCHARFRLDESKIKGRGARVKCRKCGDSIVVLKDGATAPPAADGDGFFDLGSAVRDSADASRGTASPIGNLIPFPAPPRPVEPATQEPASRIMHASEPVKDEVDLAFDRVLSTDPEPRPEMDFGTLTLDFAPEGKLDLPPLAGQEPPFVVQPVVEPSAEFRSEGEFLISDSEILDFLQGKKPEPAPEVPPRIGDISLEISYAPVDEENISLRGSDASPAPSGDWKAPSPPEDRMFSSLPRDAAAPLPQEIALQGNVTPPAATAIEIPQYREAEPAAPAESEARPLSPAPESPRPRSAAGPVAAVILVVLLAAGGFFGLTASGRKTLEWAIPGAAALWGGKSADKVASSYNVKNPIAYNDSGAASKRIFIIKGQVTNAYSTPKSGIRIHAILLDNSDKVLIEKTVYAGNTLQGDMLKTANRATLEKELSNRFGERLSNMDVPPGKTIPFMVVFFDPPENLDRYTVEAKDGE